MQITHEWYENESAAIAVAYLSLSFVAGDAAARLVLGSLVSIGFGWRAVFMFSAVLIFILTIFANKFVRHAPTSTTVSARQHHDEDGLEMIQGDSTINDNLPFRTKLKQTVRVMSLMVDEPPI